jgi:hypothetical protein
VRKARLEPSEKISGLGWMHGPRLCKAAKTHDKISEIEAEFPQTVATANERTFCPESDSSQHSTSKDLL